ncbi:DNA replication and repair protein RecF, partial [mine drainage metagenome]
MQLRRLRLKNIRSYTSAELELTRGTTLIAGDVGSGKTSLLYAIEMALFGFAEVDAGFLVRHGAPQAEVAVEIEHEGHRYEISRRFRRITRKGRHSFELERSTFSQDGATTQYSATELRQRIIDLFGF